MSRKGLFDVDPGDHSPELREFLRRWITPGCVKGKWADQPLPPLRDTTPEEFRANQRSLGWVLITTALAIAGLLVFRQQSGRTPTEPLIGISIAVLMGAAGTWLLRITRIRSRRKSPPN